MSLKMKLTSSLLAMVLMFGVMLTGIMAASQQILTMTGSVTFNIDDKSLYVKQVRIKQDNNSDPQIVTDFLPGYINGEFNMNIGNFKGINSNILGSFALYFDIINATDVQWEISRVTLSDILQSDNVSVSYSGVIGVNTIIDKDENGFKIFDPATTNSDGTFVLVITAPNSESIDLSGIEIFIEEKVEIYEGFMFMDNQVQYVGNATEVIIPESYSIRKNGYKTEIIIGNADEFYSNVLDYYAGTIFGEFYYTAGENGERTYYNHNNDFVESSPPFEFPMKFEPLYKIYIEEYDGTGGSTDLFLNYETFYTQFYMMHYIEGGFTATINGYESAHFYTFTELREYIAERYSNIAQAFPMSIELDNPILDISYTSGNQYTIDTIIADAFSSSLIVGSITSITLPSTISTVETDAFAGLDSLTNVTINSSYVYQNALGTSSSNCGGLLANATTVRVLKTIDNGVNTYLNNNFSKNTSSDDEYNIYIKV